jgi:hypothetical protein
MNRARRIAADRDRDMAAQLAKREGELAGITAGEDGEGEAKSA